MNDNQGGRLRAVSDTDKSAARPGANPAETFEFSPVGIGQNCPQDYPHPFDWTTKRKVR